jgi:hypothetical protein
MTKEEIDLVTGYIQSFFKLDLFYFVLWELFDEITMQASVQGFVNRCRRIGTLTLMDGIWGMKFENMELYAHVMFLLKMRMVLKCLFRRSFITYLSKKEIQHIFLYIGCKENGVLYYLHSAYSSVTNEEIHPCLRGFHQQTQADSLHIIYLIRKSPCLE